MHLRFLTAAVLLATVATGATAATNLVTNGNFETATYTASSEFGTAWTSGQGVTGWTGSGFALWYKGGTAGVSAANQYSDPQTYFRPNFVASQDGGSFVALDGDSSIAGAVSQTITGLTVGKGYNLTFDWAATQLINRTGVTTEQLKVTFGNDIRNTAVVTNPSGGFTGQVNGNTTSWFQQSFYFVAGSTSQTLSFLSVGTPNGLPPIAVLDGVSLTAVPEPATWAMLLTGFGLVGFAARRRHASSVAA